MVKHARTSIPVHEFIVERWSPRAYDEHSEIEYEQLIAMFEAARWAPSANNLQPWRFAVAVRGTELFEQMHGTLLPGNQAWAHRASVLIVAAAQTLRPDGTTNPWARYDLGLAVSLLTVQAHAMGLHVHQLGGFDPEGLTHVLQLPASVDPVVVLTVGTMAGSQVLEGALREREESPRERRPLEDIVLVGLNP